MKSLHVSSFSQLPENYIRFKEELQFFPDWIDEDLIRLGSQFSERSGLNGVLIFRNLDKLSISPR